MTSTTASAIRPGLRETRTLSGSPHTPSRFISSNYSSPGSTFRQEEDAVVFELNHRQLSAGFEGESGPQCTVTFGPDTSRRVGDYRTWLPNYERPDTILENEVTASELWRNDLGDVDLGLLEDKLERALREVYNKHLLTDAGTARLVLVLPSLVPLPVVSSILTTLFERWKYPTITLLPAPTMCAVAAGVRSALVVDVGWEETVVTSISEYRELATHRTTRGMKMLVLKMAEKLQALAKEHSTTDGPSLRCDLEFVEDFIARLGFCEMEVGRGTITATDGIAALSVEDTANSSASDVLVEWPGQNASRTVQFPRAEISRVVRDCFFDQRHEAHHDDHEKTLDETLFRSLTTLPPDVRGICMSRILFTGPGAAIPGLKQQSLVKVQALVEKYGWTSVRGEHVKPRRQGLAEIAQGRTAPVNARHNVALPVGKDYVEEKLLKQSSKEVDTDAQGHLRCIESLGAWAGASLASSLKVKIVVEIERERFLFHGIAGASRDVDTSVAANRVSSLGASKTGDRSNWTMGGWG